MPDRILIKSNPTSTSGLRPASEDKDRKRASMRCCWKCQLRTSFLNRCRPSAGIIRAFRPLSVHVNSTPKNAVQQFPPARRKPFSETPLRHPTLCGHFFSTENRCAAFYKIYGRTRPLFTKNTTHGSTPRVLLHSPIAAELHFTAFLRSPIPPPQDEKCPTNPVFLPAHLLDKIRPFPYLTGDLFKIKTNLWPPCRARNFSPQVAGSKTLPIDGQLHTTRK